MKSMKNEKEKILSGKFNAFIVAITMLTTILSWIVKAISSIVKITYLAQFKGQGIAITKELVIIGLTIIPAVVATIVAIKVCKELYKK